WPIDSKDSFSALLQEIHLKEPTHLEGAVVIGIHDTLNKQALPVENAKGDKWDLSGDGTLNAKSLEIGRQAVAQSQLNVLNVFKQVLALDLPALFKKVWDFVPRPRSGADETAVKTAVASGTDPKSSSTIDAIVNQIKKNLKGIVETLKEKGYLRQRRVIL